MTNRHTDLCGRYRGDVRRRLTISIDADLHDELRRRVDTGSVSAWFEEAARRRLDTEADADLRGCAARIGPDDDLGDLRALRFASPGRDDMPLVPWAALRRGGPGESSS
jgi:Arc/MetJ family transcription regulator